MLRIASSDTVTYSLFDTAAGADVTDITPLCPWSIAIPAARHVIEAIGDSLMHGPVRTAINNLEIGSTFIILKNDNG